MLYLMVRHVNVAGKEALLARMIDSPYQLGKGSEVSLDEQQDSSVVEFCFVNYSGLMILDFGKFVYPAEDFVGEEDRIEIVFKYEHVGWTRIGLNMDKDYRQVYKATAEQFVAHDSPAVKRK